MKTIKQTMPLHLDGLLDAAYRRIAVESGFPLAAVLRVGLRHGIEGARKQFPRKPKR